MNLKEDEKKYLYDLERQIEENDVYAKEKWATFFSYDHPELLNEKIIPKVLLYYEEAITQGISRAMLNLGAIYYNGTIVEQDFKKALRLYEMASKGDDDAIAAKAIANLGYCYYYGRSVAVDKGKAFNCFLKGALLFFDANCLYKLGDMYMYGDYVEKNQSIAYTLYKRAKHCNLPETQLVSDIYMRLGKCKLYGMGTDKNIVRAIEYLTGAKSALYNKIYVTKDPFAKKTMEKIDSLIAEAETKLKGK